MRLYTNSDQILHELVNGKLSIAYCYKLISRRSTDPELKGQVTYLKIALKAYRALRQLQSI